MADLPIAQLQALANQFLTSTAADIKQWKRATAKPGSPGYRGAVFALAWHCWALSRVNLATAESLAFGGFDAKKNALLAKAEAEAEEALVLLGAAQATPDPSVLNLTVVVPALYSGPPLLPRLAKTAGQLSAMRTLIIANVEELTKMTAVPLTWPELAQATTVAAYTVADAAYDALGTDVGERAVGALESVGKAAMTAAKGFIIVAALYAGYKVLSK